MSKFWAVEAPGRGRVCPSLELAPGSQSALHGVRLQYQAGCWEEEAWAVELEDAPGPA